MSPFSRRVQRSRRAAALPEKPLAPSVPQREKTTETIMTGDLKTEEPVIKVSGLEKRYGDIRAVDGVSFTVAKGETYGLLGPNGAGKTTTMRIISGTEGARGFSGRRSFLRAAKSG